jgi:hypothetical protein
MSTWNDWPLVKLVGNGRVAEARAPFEAERPQATPAVLMSLLPFPGAAPLSVDVELPTKKKTVELLVVGLSCHAPNPLPAWLPLDQMPLYGIDPKPTCVDGAATEESGLPTSAKKISQAIVA